MALPPTKLTSLLYGVPGDDVPATLAAAGYLSANGEASAERIVELTRRAHAAAASHPEITGDAPVDHLADWLVAAGLLNDAGIAAHDP